MKSAARFYVVQALFQMEAINQDLNEIKEEFENFRILPLCSVDLALKHVYGNDANCFNDSKFFTSENIRVILVLSKDFLNEDGNPLRIIKSRFPQSGKCIFVWCREIC